MGCSLIVNKGTTIILILQTIILVKLNNSMSTHSIYISCITLLLTATIVSFFSVVTFCTVAISLFFDRVKQTNNLFESE